MDDAAPGFPWSFLLGGLLATVLGVAGILRPAWLQALARAQGAAPLSAREARRYPRLFLAAGICCLVTVWGLAWPFAHGARPYVAAIAATAALPLGVLLLGGTLLDFAFLRRFRG